MQWADNVLGFARYIRESSHERNRARLGDLDELCAVIEKFHGKLLVATAAMHAYENSLLAARTEIDVHAQQCWGTKRPQEVRDGWVKSRDLEYSLVKGTDLWVLEYKASEGSASEGWYLTLHTPGPEKVNEYFSESEEIPTEAANIRVNVYYELRARADD
jgi:hypothetical protein